MKYLALLALGLATLTGCTTHLATGQKQELAVYESKGLVVEEKSVATAAVLGLLPGVPYCYVRSYGLCIATIPLYPFLGPLWQPFDVAGAAKAENYYATRAEVERQKAKALREIDHKLEDKQLTYEQHIREQRTIEARYSAY
ncbi:hypothetical protein ACSVIJ_04515 [Pseudomonas sp. NCHU5208]|uniref:hypothetical protein n=1 Tax=unclassified Pseudomonas TaxID=196821 RepID=UPI003F9A0D5A